MARTGVRTHAILLSALGCLTGLGVSAPSDYEGKPVLKIEFRPAEQPLSAARLNEILPVKLDAPLRLAEVRSAIEQLYATGRYAGIAVEAEPLEGGVLLRFITAPEYFVGGVSAEGVPEPPYKGVLANTTRLELGAPLADNDQFEQIGRAHV